MVAFVVDEYLGFILQPPKGHRVDDAVAVTLMRGAHAAFRFRHQSPAGLLGVAGIRG
jgi:hypothetical protein